MALKGTLIGAGILAVVILGGLILARGRSAPEPPAVPAVTAQPAATTAEPDCDTPAPDETAGGRNDEAAKFVVPPCGPGEPAPAPSSPPRP